MTASPRLTGLRVEGRVSPRGLDVRSPLLGWSVETGGHDVLVRRSTVRVSRALDGALVGCAEVDGDAIGAQVTPDEPWRPLTAYAWSVTADTLVDGVVTALHATASFETGLLSEADWRGARWVRGGHDDTTAAPLLRTVLELPAPPLRARLVVAAGGVADVTVNGVVAGGEVLGPGLTDYRSRVAVVVHDVTASLRTGENVLAAALGRGFYGMLTENVWGWHRAPWHDEPCVRMLLVAETADGTVTAGSGPRTTTARGGTLADSFLEGEVFDARLEPRGWRLPGFDDSDWRSAPCTSGPPGRGVARPYAGIRVVETLAPTSVERLDDGRHVVDLGRQIAGWVRLRVPAGTPPGHEIRLRSTERLVDGVPVLASPLSAGELQVDRVVTDGGPLEWEPTFGYKGFRYVEVQGWPDGLGSPDLVARAAHTDIARRARFTSSHDGLTWVHEAVVATMLNNLHHIPTDTPVFEKNGWTGDAALGARMMLRDLDTAPLLEDWMETVADSCDPVGRPALIAPDPSWVWDGHQQSPPWHAVLWTVPWELYRATGQDRVVRRHLDGVLRYLRLELDGLVDGLADSGLGDYLAPGSTGNPDEDRRVCGTIAVHEGTRAAARMAELVGRDGDAREMRHRGAELRRAFRRAFLDAATGTVRDAVAGFRQTHQVLALDAGLLDPPEATRAAAALARDVEERGGHLCVGALGVRRALPVLDDHGHGATAFRAATATEPPGWLAWRAAGATTTWEFWDDRRSRNHYFLGTIDDWLFGRVAGLRLASPGYRRVRVRPEHLTRLAAASAVVGTVRGELAVDWEVDGGDGVLRLRLPHGTTAVVELPGSAPVEATGSFEARFAVGSGRTPDR